MSPLDRLLTAAKAAGYGVLWCRFPAERGEWRLIDQRGASLKFAPTPGRLMEKWLGPNWRGVPRSRSVV